MSDADTLHAALSRWLEDGDRAALETAHAQALQMKGIDVGALLEWIDDHGIDSTRTDLALRRIRHALGLPVVAGPVCRPRAN
jgi:hypothetical protein